MGGGGGGGERGKRDGGIWWYDCLRFQLTRDSRCRSVVAASELWRDRPGHVFCAWRVRLGEEGRRLRAKKKSRAPHTNRRMWFPLWSSKLDTVLPREDARKTRCDSARTSLPWWWRQTYDAVISDRGQHRPILADQTLAQTPRSHTLPATIRPMLHSARCGGDATVTSRAGGRQTASYPPYKKLAEEGNRDDDAAVRAVV